MSKLKDRIDIDHTNSTETIKSLIHLPKAWTNEAIEKRAGESGERKRKQKRTAEASEGGAVQTDAPNATESAKKRIVSEEVLSGEKRNKSKARNKQEHNANGKSS